MATVTAGLRRRRPLENAVSFFVLLVLPLLQRPCARWGYPHPRSDAVSICVVLVRDATHHPRQMVPSQAASMRRGAAGSCTGSAAGCAQAPRRCRVLSAARRLPHVVRCNRLSSVATARRPLQPPPVARLASDRVALSQRRASITSQARNALCCKIRLPPDETRRSVPLGAVAPIGMWACGCHVCTGGICSHRRWCVVD